MHAAGIVLGDHRLAVIRVRESVILHQRVGHVDAEAVDSAVQPELQDVHEFVEHLGVAPVQVGLLAREQVVVPLKGL